MHTYVIHIDWHELGGYAIMLLCGFVLGVTTTLRCLDITMDAMRKKARTDVLKKG